MKKTLLFMMIITNLSFAADLSCLKDEEYSKLPHSRPSEEVALINDKEGVVTLEVKCLKQLPNAKQSYEEALFEQIGNRCELILNSSIKHFSYIKIKSRNIEGSILSSHEDVVAKAVLPVDIKIAYRKNIRQFGGANGGVTTTLSDPAPELGFEVNIGSIKLITNKTDTLSERVFINKAIVINGLKVLFGHELIEKSGTDISSRVLEYYGLPKRAIYSVNGFETIKDRNPSYISPQFSLTKNCSLSTDG